MKLTPVTIQHLTTLLTACKRSASWYRRLSSTIEDGAARAALQRALQQRQAFASALEALIVREAGQAPALDAGEPTHIQPGPFAGHEALAELCEGHDWSCVETYQLALDAGLDAEAERLVLGQFQQLIDAYDTMRLRRLVPASSQLASAAA